MSHRDDYVSTVNGQWVRQDEARAALLRALYEAQSIAASIGQQLDRDEAKRGDDMAHEIDRLARAVEQWRQ